MASKVAEPNPIDVVPGVMPITDSTAARTVHFIYTKAIRFVDGVPEKVGGNVSIDFDYDATISGTVRTIFTDIVSGIYYALFGSNEKLYSMLGSRLTNITPLVTSSTAAANSLATLYGTLANNPLSTTNGSPTITVADTSASRLTAGDTITLSGSSAVAGIAAGSINASHIVRSVGVNVFTINVGTNANATTSGGGAAVVRKTGIIQVTSAAHGQANGDRIRIEGSADTGGILAADINLEFIIRNVDTNTFDVMTAGTATSSVSGGGGAGTVYYKEIADGNLNESATQGYGAGFYGVGLYGTALTSASARSYPRIWSIDRYADTFVMTPGNQTGVYQWEGLTTESPVLVSGAPTAVNYIFVSNNILVTLGASGTENRIFASDQNDITEWTSSSTNQVFDDDVEGAGRLLSHCEAENINLIFTENKTYTFRYIGLPLIWEILPLDESVGLIAPSARSSAKGMAFWMGQENFYMYRGGKVEIIKANTQNQCTALRYVFDDLNYGQKSKIFSWYNKSFNEIWFHYPSANSNEPDRVIRVNILDYTWSIDLMDRTAAESPAVLQKNPILANSGIIYRHEFGFNDDEEAMDFILTSNRRNYGKDNVVLTGIIPDSIQTGNVTFNVTGYRYPQSANASVDNDYTVGPTTEQVPITSAARYMEYTWSGEVIDQDWVMGQWMEELQPGPRQ